MITEDNNLSLKIREYLHKLLSSQEVTLSHPILSTYFAHNPDAEQIPKNLVNLLQSDIISKLNCAMQTLDAFMSISSEFRSWRQLKEFHKARTICLNSIRTERARSLVLIESYIERIDKYLISMNLYLQHVSRFGSSSYDVLLDWISVKTDALLLKTKLLQFEYYEDTYTPDVIRQLSTISSSKDGEICQLNLDIKKYKSALQSYASVSGPAFEILVKQYGKLDHDIENKKWALNQFSSFSPNET